MFSMWKHTRHYWTTYTGPTTVRTDKESILPGKIIYMEKCWGCGKVRTITVEPDKAPVIRESEEA